MDYLDFELRIASGTDREYPVTIVSSPVGEANGTLRFPFDPLSLERHLQGVELALLRSVSVRRDALANPTDAESVRGFGTGLFESLFAGQIETTFRRSRDWATSEGKGLRVRLRIRRPGTGRAPVGVHVRPDRSRLRLPVDSNPGRALPGVRRSARGPDGEAAPVGAGDQQVLPQAGDLAVDGEVLLPRS